jgi:hypothetical protein
MNQALKVRNFPWWLLCLKLAIKHWDSAKSMNLYMAFVMEESFRLDLLLYASVLRQSTRFIFNIYGDGGTSWLQRLTNILLLNISITLRQELVLSLHHHIYTGSGAHPASYPMSTTGSFPVGKTAGTWSWPLISIYCSTPQYAFMTWCSVKSQGQLYL